MLTLWGGPGLFLIFGVGLVAVLFHTVEDAERSRLQLETDITANQVSLRLEAWIDDRVAVSDYLANREFRDEADALARFSEVAGRLIDLHAGFQALNYVDPDGIIRVVVPQATNQAALGMDLDEHPTPGVDAAIRAARQGTRPVRSPAIDLYQGGRGLATYHAMRDPDGRLIGLVNCVFRLEPLVSACLHEDALRQGFRFELLGDAGQPVYRHAPDPGSDDATWEFAVELPVMVVDRPWILHLAPRPDHIDQGRTRADEVLGVLGLLLVATLAVVAHLLVRRQIALTESRARYQLLVENQTDLLVKVDTQGRFLYVSPSYCDLFGLPESELIGREFMPLVHEDDRESTAAAVARLFEPPHHVTIEQRALTRHGWRWLTWTDTAVLDERGEVAAIIGAGRDITRQKDLESQLRQSQKMQAIGQLAGGIAHDFNNLLQAMLGHLELLEHDIGPSGPDAAADLAAVKRSAQRAAELTRQLLAFSRQQVQSVRVHDLSAVVDELEPLLTRLLGDGIRLAVRTTSHPVLVKGDRGQLEQVVLNLCVNARDAIDDAGDITITVTAADGRARLSVADTGRGISPEVRTRIFEPFFTTKDVGAGTGLGLATVFGIVEQHGGEIEVESEPGRGACFTVTLPLSRAAASDEPAAPDAVVRGGHETILVAEDEDTLRALTARVLQQSGYQVLLAADGEEAVRLQGENPDIDLAVLDVMMPRLGGRGAARAIHDRHPNLPVIFISGHPGLPGTEEQAMLAEDEVLLKPFDAATLLARIRRALDAAPGRSS
ncbi:MAG: ATP-binding protein [Candidatus Krumholzibacteriia bacterium]